MNEIKRPLIEQIMSHREPRHERNHYCTIWLSIILSIYLSYEPDVDIVP
jgi:hypothetical protein